MKKILFVILFLILGFNLFAAGSYEETKSGLSQAQKQYFLLIFTQTEENAPYLRFAELFSSLGYEMNDKSKSIFLKIPATDIILVREMTNERPTFPATPYSFFSKVANTYASGLIYKKGIEFIKSYAYSTDPATRIGEEIGMNAFIRLIEEYKIDPILFLLCSKILEAWNLDLNQFEE